MRRVVSLRIAEELYLWLKKRAAKNKRSLNKEVAFLLQQLKEKEASGKDKQV